MLSQGVLYRTGQSRDRGVPRNPSQQVREELRAIRDHERTFGTGEFQGYTYIDFAEVESVDWQRYGVQVESSDWWLLFRIIQLLRSDARFSNAGFRIVCWVSW